MTRNNTDSAAPSWTPRQLSLITTMANPPFPTLAAAAKHCKIPIDSAKRWHCREAFRAAVDAATKEVLKEFPREINRQIAGLSEEAIVTIRENLAAPSFAVRQSAAVWILERIVGKTPDRVRHEGIEMMVEELLRRPTSVDPIPLVDDPEFDESES
jgi:hypothetical protein